jgi:hypothetical protein
MLKQFEYPYFDEYATRFVPVRRRRRSRDSSEQCLRHMRRQGAQELGAARPCDDVENGGTAF